MNENFKNMYLGVLSFNISANQINKCDIERFARRCKSIIRLFTLGRQTGKCHTTLMAVGCRHEA